MTEPESNQSFPIDRASPEDIARRFELEKICSEFESGWTRESVRQLEELTQGADPSIRPDLVFELVASDFDLRQILDSQLTCEEYVSQLPKFPPFIQNAIQRWIATNPPLAAEKKPTIEKQSFVPKQIGDYRIVKLIGQGGNGAVYEAIQESLNRRVAIKTLNFPHVASHLSRFQQEARAVAMLHHTNIVEVHGSGIDGGVPYFAMQLIEGCGLDQLIHPTNPATQVDEESLECVTLGDRGQTNVARIGLQVARALGHAHEKGILHRDVKPSNLLIDKNGNAWVSDFGTAKLRNEDSQNTIDGSVVGTMRYVPPEAFSGSWSERADIYSLGVTLYESLALKPAFSAEDYPQLIKQITQVDRAVKPLSQINHSISKDLETIVSKAMSFEPEQRYQSADEMAAELERYLDGLPIKSRPTSTMEKLWRWAKRKPTAAALALLITAVAFIGLPISTWLWLQASSALEIAEVERSHANQMQVESEESRRNAEAARYSSGILLAANYIDDGRVLDARRLLEELKPIVSSMNDSPVETWEWVYLNQKIDTSILTLSGDKNLGVWQVAIRPDDLQIATVHALEASYSQLDGEVILWNAQTGRKDHVLREEGSRVYGCAYSHDGKRLATIGLYKNRTKGDSANERGTICIWNTDTGKRLKRVKLTGEYDDMLLHSYGRPILPGIQFSDDDQQIITWPNPVEVRDSNSLDVKWHCNARSAIVLPNQRMLAYNGKLLKEYDLISGKQFNAVDDQNHNFVFFSLSNGRQKLACTAQNHLRLWDTAASIEDYRDLSLPGAYWSSIFPSGSQLAYGTRKGDIHIQSLDPSESEVSRLMLGHQATVTSGAFTKDGNWLVTGSKDGTAKIWDLGQTISTLDTNLTHDRISTFSFAKQGTEIVYCGRKDSVELARPNAGNFELTEYPPDTSKSPANVETTHCAHWPRGDFSFTQDGVFLAAPIAEPKLPKERVRNAKGGFVGIWNCQNWKLLQTVDTQLSETSVTGWTNDNRLLAVGGLENDVHKIRLFQIVNNTAIPVGEILLPEKLLSIAFHDDERLAVATENRILIWKLARQANSDSPTGTQGYEGSESQTAALALESPRRIPVEGQVVSIDFSPDGSRLASADFTNDMLEVYDTRSGSRCYQRPGPRRFCSVRFSPCGRRLALSGFDSVVNLCDAEYGYPVLTLIGCLSSPGTFSINSKVRFSPDGQQIATNNWEGKIVFWDLSDQK